VIEIYNNIIYNLLYKYILMGLLNLFLLYIIIKIYRIS